MFCKFCESKVDPYDSTCPKCGKRIKTEGGNSFWDLAGEPRPTKVPEPVNPPVPGGEPPKQNLVIPIAVCIFSCVLCVAFLLMGLISNSKTIKKNEEKVKMVEASYEWQKSSYEDRIRNLEERIASLEQSAASKTEYQQSQKSVEIVHNPTDEEKPTEYGREDEKGLFSCIVNVEATSFTWEKQQDNGEWIALAFGDDGVDNRYGLKQKNDLKKGSSILLAVGLTEEADGIYRCTVDTDYGRAFSREVHLIITDKQGTPIATPAESASVYTPTIEAPDNIG